MYLHLGQATIIPTREIIGIFDLDKVSSFAQGLRFLNEAERRGEVINVSEELPKSFVLCQGAEGKSRLYISQLNSTTLLRRAEVGLLEEQFTL